MNELIKHQIHQLLLDPEFEELQNMLTNEVDFMSILRVGHKELQHSNILSWLFNPNENHGLGEYFARSFIKKCFVVNKFKPIGYNDKNLSIIQFDEMDLDDLLVKREHYNIDLLLSSDKSNFVMVIENKIFSIEGNNQLAKYREYAENEYVNSKHLVLVYLSLFEQSISDNEQSNYLRVTYVEIKSILEEILNSSRLHLKENIKFIIQQYLKSLQSIMNDNQELELLCKKLYRKYKPAFDEVIKYNMTSGYGKVAHNLVDLIKNRADIRPYKTSKSYVRFQPNFLVENEEILHKNGFLSENENINDSWLFLYEFNIGKETINFDFKIGISELPEARRKLFDRFQNDKELFNKVDMYKGTLYTQWHLCFQDNILTKSKYDSLFETPDELEKHIKRRFDKLMDEKIPLINQAIKEVVGIS